MKLHRWERELFGDVCVFDGGGLIDRFALDPFGSQRRAGDGRSTSKSLELGISDVAIVVHLDLKSHHISASGSSYKSCTNILLLSIQFSDITGILVVINDLSMKSR